VAFCQAHRHLKFPVIKAAAHGDRNIGSRVSSGEVLSVHDCRDTHPLYEPWPTVTLHLTAGTAVASVLFSALYSIDGQTVGRAMRALTITALGQNATTASAQEKGVALDIPLKPEPTDLEARILQHGDQLVWSFENPHKTIPLPTKEIEIALPTHPTARFFLARERLQLFGRWPVESSAIAPARRSSSVSRHRSAEFCGIADAYVAGRSFIIPPSPWRWAGESDEGRHDFTSLWCISNGGQSSLKLPHPYPFDVVRDRS